MATIVQHRESGERFVLLGVGLGMTATSRPSLLFGDLSPAEEESVTQAVAVCDATGSVRWLRSASLAVVSVDGATPADVLQSP